LEGKQQKGKTTEKIIKTGNNEVKDILIEPTPNFKGFNPYIKGSEKITKLVPFKTELSNSEFELENINLVSISLPEIQSQDLRLIENGDPFPLNHCIADYSSDYRKLLYSEFKNAIDYAIDKYKANIICINELGMPTNKNGTGNNRAIQYARKIANKHKCLIIAGSNHSTAGYFNVGYIFYPGLDREGNDYRYFLKNITAFQIGEKLFTPSERKIYHTKAFGLGISFLICLEIADYSSSASIAKNKDHIDLLLVPSYLRKYGPMENIAEKVSEACGGVLLNNCFVNMQDFPSSRLYLYGEAASDKDQVSQKVLPGNKTKVVLRRINVKDFKKRKADKIQNLSRELCYLYDIKYRMYG